jgi:protein-S-isoprenylcysteine O-methyltransferase Ste14
MNALELKIPPPLVSLIIALAMWGISSTGMQMDIPFLIRAAATLVFALAGGIFGVSGIVSVIRAKTTIHPERPEDTSLLITSGIYSLTRNPMYLGILFGLITWAVSLASAWALLGPVIFILYITRFQIVPEERTLALKFGPDYAAYKARVHRWI